MKKRERQEYIKNEIQAIYDEFSIYANQIFMLQPFIKNLMDVANGADPIYDLGGFKSKNNNR